jgi:hypothetical protein
MSIRKRISWRQRTLAIVLLIVVIGGITLAAYALGRGMNPFGSGISGEQAYLLDKRIVAAGAERDRIAGALSASESQLAIERATHKQLSAQLKSLENENARLQEDLSFFESLLPAGPASQDISIRRLKFEAVVPNQLRYRLLVMRRGKAEPDFKGSLQFSIQLMRGGAQATLLLPDKTDASTEQFGLEFRHYQRIEGILTLPEGAQVRTVQVRVLENGKLRAQQSANM